MRGRHGTYCGNELVDTVGGHAVEVREVELQVDLVVEHVLAQRASQHGLDRVLRHHVHSETIQVGVGELAVGALVHLDGGGDSKRRRREKERGGGCRKKRNTDSQRVRWVRCARRGLLEEELYIRQQSGPPPPLPSTPPLPLEQADPSDHIQLCNAEHHRVLAPTSKCSHLSNTILIFHLGHN